MGLNLSSKLSRLWEEVRGTPPVQPVIAIVSSGPESDADELLPKEEAAIGSTQGGPPTWQVSPISGINMSIRYRDSKGQASERQIVCRRLESYGETAQLVAWCALRNRQRNFRVDRILSAWDSANGQVFEPGSALLDHFILDRESSGRYRFGLSPQRFEVFNAALNVMAFVARCDGNWHVLEAEAIEDFVVACWMRLELPGDLDLNAVAAHVARLSPDDEVLWKAVETCAANPVLAKLIVRHLGNIIDADGIHHPREVYWATNIADALTAPHE